MKEKKITKKERKEIYEEAITMMYGSRVICFILGAIISKSEYDSCGDGYPCENYYIKNLFPEFELFEPFPMAYNWFGHQGETERIIALQLCVEMCNK